MTAKTWEYGKSPIRSADLNRYEDYFVDLFARVAALEATGGGGSVDPTTPTGEGYVGAIASASPYSEMRVTAIDDAYDMTGFDIIHTGSGRTRTIRLQGKYIAGTPNVDAYQRMEEIWLGDYLAVPRSNLEFAFQITAGGVTDFVPYHGTAKTEYARPTVYRDLDGNVLALDSLAYGTSIVPNGLVVDQSVYARHSQTGTTNLVQISTLTTFYPDGLIELEGHWEALQEIVVGSVYAPMVPYAQADMTKLEHSGGTVALDTAPVAANTNQDLPDTITSGLLTASSRPAVQIAWAWTDPNATLRWAEPDRKTNGVKIFVQRRVDGINKVYPHAFTIGSTIAAGSTWDFSAQWRIQEAKGA